MIVSRQVGEEEQVLALSGSGSIQVILSLDFVQVGSVSLDKLVRDLPLAELVQLELLDLQAVQEQGSDLRACSSQQVSGPVHKGAEGFPP